MSLEFPSPSLRNAIDMFTPIDVGVEDWRGQTQQLAKAYLDTVHLMMENLSVPLRDSYFIDMAPVETHESQNIILTRWHEETEGSGRVASDFSPLPGTWLRLMPHDESDTLKPIVLMDATQNSATLILWGSSSLVKFRNEDLVVRQRQIWKLIKVGDEWQPSYKERIVFQQRSMGITRDLISSYFNGDLAREIDARGGEFPLHLITEIDKNVRDEVYQAVGFSTHQTFGPHVLEECHVALETIRLFIKGEPMPDYINRG